MGCGCGKRNTPGMTSSNPLVLGTAQEVPTIMRVRLIEGVAGVPSGVKRYVTGSEVEALIASGVLQAI